MSAIARWDGRQLMDLLDWAESPMAMFRPFNSQAMRLETYVKDGRYIMRAELPGVNPERDIDVTVNSGVLTVHAERREEKVDKTHSEFRYGEFTRHAALPEGTDESSVAARYDNGILQITAQIRPEKAERPERKIKVTASSGKKAGK